MDHWGDPWADNANDKSSTKSAVTSPLPPTFTFAPAPLGDFVDDAGWGNDHDDGLGGWTTSDAGNTVSLEVASTPARDADPNSAADWGTAHQGGEDLSPEWPYSATDAVETVDSEPSDSSTVSQVDGNASQEAVEEHVQPQIDLESSVRSSTSPSETSRNDLPIESPRTSVEDERAGNKDGLPPESLDSTAEAHPDSAVSSASFSPDLSPASTATSDAHEGEKDGNDSEAHQDLENHAVEARAANDALSTVLDSQTALSTERDPQKTPGSAAEAPSAQPHATSDAFVCDNTLLAQLFPTEKQTDRHLYEHSDPIFTTSARKAWYRVTRKQTMREFNHGDNDDNYIRVTWTNSHVRAEVHKIVNRWAREDRISGTGPGARASFYWDTPAPTVSEAPFGHSRTQSAALTTKTALPARQSLPPLASAQSAAFNWSSSAPTDPWMLESPSQRLTPLAPKNPVVAKLQRQEGRAVSVDLTPNKSGLTMHKRTGTVSHNAHETRTVAGLISPPISQPSTEVLSPSASSDKPDSSSVPTVEPANTSFDDDDDWGEMVQTPTLPTPQQLDPFSQPLDAKTTPPSSSSPPTSLTSIAGEEAGLVEPMFATPIVRLQSTISPTSALFKANTFVPLNAEVGPIGPSVLKPAKRPLRSTTDERQAGVPEGMIVESSGPVPISLKVDESREGIEAVPQTMTDSVSFSDTQDAVGKINMEVSSTPVVQPATSDQVPSDAWADVDFSFFESAMPASAPQPIPQAHPSDAFSHFNTPAAASTPPLSKSSSRSPPRSPTPPALRPLSGTTSSVQQRKAEEDRIIDSILRGLPDLSYMLQR